ncbi:RusA family crossover junction endodeoxyribonuclease [Burkholderia cenocepacia]|uniref:RusA family crossover junction endodeoxyribonuclease n=1 Tax=Burkholderia cenocepacia TaxID=95486 RepID=UPI00285C1EAD|nr:RusA family crossover junction endodeoxyribonuclease [Burkholderia cenocepacia]MDR8105561.1 RusA family crossover junction endodeoxyribonuclease [Burkholderia cenocepacia]
MTSTVLGGCGTGAGWNSGTVRNVGPALKGGSNGVAYVDDGQVVDLWVSKRYARTPGVRIEAIELNLKSA